MRTRSSIPNAPDWRAPPPARSVAPELTPAASAGAPPGWRPRTTSAPSQNTLPSVAARSSRSRSRFESAAMRAWIAPSTLIGSSTSAARAASMRQRSPSWVWATVIVPFDRNTRTSSSTKNGLPPVNSHASSTSARGMRLGLGEERPQQTLGVRVAQRAELDTGMIDVALGPSAAGVRTAPVEWRR